MIKPSAAADLWQQLLERARRSEWSTFQDPEYIEPPQKVERDRKAFIEAGWSTSEVDFILGNRSEKLVKGVSSSGVAPHTETALARIAEMVRSAASEILTVDFSKIEFVVEPKAGPLISLINVMMTDESIIAMGSFFTRYCGLVARAYTRTVLLAPWLFGADADDEKVRKLLRENSSLLLYWWRIFVSFALTGTHILTSFKPSRKEEVILFEQIAHSMEVFALAHEVAHHVHRDVRKFDDGSDRYPEEYDADRVAVKIARRVDEQHAWKWIRGSFTPNPYLSSGAGGVLLLGSLEIFRDVKDKVYKNTAYNTHPHFLDRSERIKLLWVLEPNMYKQSLEFCGAVESVLRCVKAELSPLMLAFPVEQFAKDFPVDWEVQQEERS